MLEMVGVVRTVWEATRVEANDQVDGEVGGVPRKKWMK